MFSKIDSAICNCPIDGTIYLVEKLSSITGFFVSDKRLIYMVYNFENIKHQNLCTEYLHLYTNIEISSIKNNQMFESGRYNLLELVRIDEGYDENNLNSFIKLCVAHTELMVAQNLVGFFYSLTNLFQMPKEQHVKNLIGLYGELSFIKYLCENAKIDLSEFWHKGGSGDKYEFVLSDKNLEVKTTSSKTDLITIKHSQLFNGDNNYLIAVSLEENSAGKTLNELIFNMQQDPRYYKNYNFALNIEREKKRISLVDAANKKFIVKSITAYRANEVNPFVEIPECVCDLTYKMSLDDKVMIPEEKWGKEFGDV